MDPAAQVAARDARQAARAANDDLPIDDGPPVNDEKGGPRDDEEAQRLVDARDEAPVLAERRREENVDDGARHEAKGVEESDDDDSSVRRPWHGETFHLSRAHCR